MSDCAFSTPLSFPVLHLQKFGLTAIKRCGSNISPHCSGARNGCLKLLSTRAIRKSRALDSEESEFSGELGFKDKTQEHLELKSRMPNDEGNDSADLDFLELKDEKRVKEEDLVRVRDNKEIEESKQVGLKRRRQMIRRSNLLAKQVISIQSALCLGFISQIWVDTTSWMVVAVEVRPNLLSGESERFLLEDVERVGDVVLIKGENVLDNELKMNCLETLVGYRVVTPGRRYIGKVRGYSFNVNSGAVELLELDSFGISIIPSSLVSTYAVPVEDVLGVLSDTVIVHEAAASQIQRLTKGLWDAQKLGTAIDEIGEYSDSEVSGKSDHGSTHRSLRSQKFRTRIRGSEDNWELPMDYL